MKCKQLNNLFKKYNKCCLACYLFGLILILVIVPSIIFSGFKLLHFSDGLIGSIIGGALAIVAAIGSVQFQHNKNKQREKQKEDEFKHNSLLAMQVELNSLWEAFKERMGNAITSPNSDNGIYSFFPIQQNYFIIYKEHAIVLGKLDPKISAHLVKTYIDAMGLVDSLLLNNQTFNSHGSITMASSLNTDIARQGFFDHYQNLYETELTRYVGFIRNLYKKIESNIARLNELIEKHSQDSHF